MKILGIETSTYSGSVAIVVGESVIAEVFLNSGRTNAEKLVTMTEWLLKEARMNKQEIGGIAVSIGPGSFTSLRVGISTAKAIAYSLRVPIAGVSSLEVIAGNLPFTPLDICSIIDARKKEVFAAFFKYRNSHLNRVGDDMIVSPEAIFEKVREKTVFIGDGVFVYEAVLKDTLGELAIFAPPAFNYPKASNCAVLGARKLKEGLGDDSLALVPRYLRRADVEI